MGYCETGAVREMLKDDVISSLLGYNRYVDGPEADQLIEPLIIAALEDADAEIDGYLCNRYSVPLSTVPPMIGKLSKDIAIYNLMSRSGIDEGERESNYLTRYKAAIAYLKLVTEGKADIGISGSGAGSAAPSTKMHFSSASKIFGRNNLNGM